MAASPTACHSPMSEEATPSTSGLITDEDTLPSSQTDVTLTTTHFPPLLDNVPATSVLDLASLSRSARRMRRIARPACDSLFDIMHQYAGSSLFLRPFCWTDEHTRLLGANFDELPPCTTPLPENIPGSPPSNGHMRPSRAITTLSKALTEILEFTSNPRSMAMSVRTVMATLWPSTFRMSRILTEMHLFFGDRVYRDATRMQLVWNFPGDSPLNSQTSFKSISTRATDSHSTEPISTPVPTSRANLPMMCYMSKAQIAGMRQNMYRVMMGPAGSENIPVFRLQQLRSKTLVPANADHDAYMVGLFLVMAQRHFYGAPAPSPRRDSQWSPTKGKPERPDFQDIKLRILSHDDETEEFLVYTAVVTAEFLDRFHDPLRTPRDEEGNVPGLQIEYARVPIWPILGLRERMGKALGVDLVGPFNASKMETWEAEPDDTQGSQKKRKREALSEVFNGSYEEETDDDTRGPIDKKQRLGSASPVGVVV